METIPVLDTAAVGLDDDPGIVDYYYDYYYV